MTPHPDAYLVGPLSVDRYLTTGRELPGGGALNMAVHWARRGIAVDIIGRVAADRRDHFESFLERHRIGSMPSLVVDGEACSIDIRFAADRQPIMDNFVEGVFADFQFTDAEADRVASGTPTHLVLVDSVDRALHRLAADRPLDRARLTGDFLSFRHFDVERFTRTIRLLEIGFVGWPGDRDDPMVAQLVERATEAEAILVVTFGSAGVRVVDARAGSPRDEWFDVDAVEVVGTTVGCGDAFTAAFLAEWYAHGDIDRAIVSGRQLGAEATTWGLALPDDAFD